MGNYENGAFTRRVIVDACKKLFYEKGYHETSYADICMEAHVNRGTIYYHFPNKELMRLEVLWEFFIEQKRIAEKHCPDHRYCGVIAIAIFWLRTHKDEKMRNFTRCVFWDHPIFNGKRNVSYFYYEAYDYMWSGLIEKSKISPMAFTSVYGYIASCILLLCEHPEKYDTWDIFEHCSRSSLRICGASEELIDEIFTTAKKYYDALPEDAWKLTIQEE